VALIRSELDSAVEPATAAVISEIKRGAIALVGGDLPSASSPSVRADEAASGGADANPGVPPEAAGARIRSADVGARAWSLRMMPTAVAAALVMFVAGAWILAQNRLGLPSLGTRVSRTGAMRAMIDPAWASPIPRLSGVGQAALEAQGVTPIMVWPFTATPEAAERDAALADTITDDLITSLSRFPTLRVISRLTAVSYQGRNRNAAEVGAELGVRYVVEGSVRQHDGVVRVNVALVDTTSGLELWGDRFQKAEDARAGIQDEIVIRIARELDIGVATALSRQAQAPQDAGVRELLAKGAIAQLRGPAAENIVEARNYFEGALIREPTLVPALVGIAAQELMGVVNLILDSRTSTTRAAMLLARARELDPSSPLVEYSTGMLHKARREYAAALRSFYRVLELNPSHTPAYAQIASNLTMLGRAREAMEPIIYAMRLSPQDPMMGIWTLIAGLAELENGHYGAAADWFRRSIALVPNNPNTHRGLAATYALLGDNEGAARQLSVYRRLSARAETQRAREQQFIDNDVFAGSRRLRAGLRMVYALAPGGSDRQ
jgi:TolB-like protein